MSRIIWGKKDGNAYVGGAETIMLCNNLCDN